MSDDLPEELRRRLANKLDSVPLASPRPEQARYRLRRAALRRPLLPGLALGFATGATAVLLAGILTTGSANPVVWTNRLGAVIREIEPVASPTPAEPSAEPSKGPAPTPSRAAGPPVAAPPARATPEPGRGESPEPQRSESPEPSQRPRPSPTPRESGSPRPTPTESDGH